MKKFRKEILAIVSCFALLLGAGTLAQAAQDQKYPTKPIDLIAPYAPGGGLDTSARLIASYVSKKFGVPVNVVNVTGASGVIGMTQVLKSKPDGYTMLLELTPPVHSCTGPVLICR